MTCGYCARVELQFRPKLTSSGTHNASRLRFLSKSESVIPDFPNMLFSCSLALNFRMNICINNSQQLIKINSLNKSKNQTQDCLNSKTKENQFCNY